MIHSSDDMADQEFDMLFWRDGNVWRRYWSTQPDQLVRDITGLREQHGPLVGVMIVHHPQHYPLPATIYSDAGITTYLKEIRDIVPQIDLNTNSSNRKTT